MQLCIDNELDTIFEWVPYNQFDDVKEIRKSDFTSIYSSRRKDGPFHYDEDRLKLISPERKRRTLHVQSIG